MKLTTQEILNSGLNVFGLQLFIESVARFKPELDRTEPYEFEYEHRGTKTTVKIWLSVTLPEDKSNTE